CWGWGGGVPVGYNQRASLRARRGFRLSPPPRVDRRCRFLFASLAAGLMIAPATAAPPPEPVTLKGHTGWVGGVAFSRDGKTLATASADNTVKLWRVESGKEIATPKGHEDAGTSVAFDPPGRVRAPGSFDGP